MKKKRINITESDLLSGSCIVKGFLKFDGKWIEYRAFSWRCLVFTPLN